MCSLKSLNGNTTFFIFLLLLCSYRNVSVTLLRYFAYNLTNVYLTLLAGSLFNALDAAIAKPTSVITLLGSALPSVSIFFINYILSQTLLSVPLLLLRIGPLIMISLSLKCFNQRKLTRRQLFEGPLKDCSLDYGAALPAILYILCIVLLYWVIAPLIPFVAIFFFSGMYVAFKYQFLYVLVPSYEIGGKFWFLLYNRTMLSLMISTIAMIGYMAIKEGAAQTPLLVPLPIFVMWAWYYTEGKFKRFSMNMAYSIAVAKDKDPASAAVIESFRPDFYKQRAITILNALIYPYRIRDVPLINSKGEVDEVYHNEDARGNEKDDDGKSSPPCHTLSLSDAGAVGGLVG